MGNSIDTGDAVLHRPSGEKWLVAFVDGDRLTPRGWPLSCAMLSDCELVRKATPERRARLLDEMADMRDNAIRAADAQSRYWSRAMPNSLRDLARHPEPADSVSVPRDLFEYMRGFMDETDRGFRSSATEAEFSEIRERIAQADAILATKAAP